MRNEAMLHVSDFNHLDRCDRMAWLARHKPMSRPPAYFMTRPFQAYWQPLAGLENAPGTTVGASTADTLQLMAANDGIVNARFEYKDLRVRIPGLKKQPDGTWHAFYPHMSVRPMETEARTIKINQLAAAYNGIEISDNFIISFNKDYQREGEIDPAAMLSVHQGLYARNGRGPKDLHELLAKTEVDLDAMIAQAHGQLQAEPEIRLQKACVAKKRCPYYEVCFDDSCRPDDDVIFLTTSSHKFEAINDHIQNLADLSPEYLDGASLQYAQVQAARLGGRYLDAAGIQAWLAQIQYPISYLDFEWDTFSVPPYERMKPFEVVCFQYSLHIEEKGQPLVHKDFFGTQDCRREFIESLLAAVPETGSVMVFNMEGGEKLRLKQLAAQFPEYEAPLNEICGRMIDLAKPFENGLFYDGRQRGHFSLKSILPVFSPDAGYADLGVKDGLQAVQAYRSFYKLNSALQEKVREDIRTYCAMDTYAEYLIYHGLLEALNIKD